MATDTRPIDSEHAEILRGHVRALNTALHEAWKAGLKVELRISEGQMLGHQPAVSTHINVYKPL